jgi:hypothetical protein
MVTDDPSLSLSPDVRKVKDAILIPLTPSGICRVCSIAPSFMQSNNSTLGFVCHCYDSSATHSRDTTAYLPLSTE